MSRFFYFYRFYSNVYFPIAIQNMRILIFIVLVSASLFMHGQDVSFGIKGGINFSNASQGDFNTSAITSFHLGGMMEARYSDKLAIQPEILFSFQGFDYINENNIDSNSRLSYINVPVLLKYYVIEELSLNVGPQIGFLSSAKIKRNTPDGSKTEDVKNSLRSNDLSITVGITYYFSKRLNVNARYCHGLTNVVNRLADDNFKNRVLQLSVGYFF